MSRSAAVTASSDSNMNPRTPAKFMLFLKSVCFLDCLKITALSVCAFAEVEFHVGRIFRSCRRLEVRFRREVSNARNQRGRKLPDGGVIRPGGFIELLTFNGNSVFGPFNLRLQI